MFMLKFWCRRKFYCNNWWWCRWFGKCDTIVESKVHNNLAVAYIFLKKKWFIWCKNVRCYMFPSPWITDSLGFFILTFACWTTVEYHFEDISVKKWMSIINNDASNKNCVSFLNRWDFGTFKVLSMTKLENIFESLTDIGNPFHDSLSFAFYHHLCT